MVENQLHRYSKVLEYNIGNVFSVKQLPTCLELEPLNTNQPGPVTEAALRWGGDGPSCQARAANDRGEIRLLRDTAWRQ